MLPEDEEVLPRPNWSTTAPVEEWTAYNVCKFISYYGESPTELPVLIGIDRTFKNYCVPTMFMDVRFLHPPTQEEVEVKSMPCPLLYQTAPYHDAVKAAEAAFDRALSLSGGPGRRFECRHSGQ